MTSRTFNALSNDLWGSPNFDIVSGTSTLIMGNSSVSNDGCRTWIPFTVALPKNLVILTGTLRVTADTTRNDIAPVQIGCESTVNPTEPADWAALNGKALTTSFLSTTPPDFTAGVAYDFDITGAVQEMLNKAGWTNGANLAVLIIEDGATFTNRKIIKSSESGTPPQLIVTFIQRIPVSGTLL